MLVYTGVDDYVTYFQNKGISTVWDDTFPGHRIYEFEGEPTPEELMEEALELYKEVGPLRVIGHGPFIIVNDELNTLDKVKRYYYVSRGLMKLR